MIKKGFFQFKTICLILILGLVFSQAYGGLKSEKPQTGKDDISQPDKETTTENKTSSINDKEITEKPNKAEAATKKSNPDDAKQGITVQKGDIIKVEYIGKLQDGTIISQSEKDKPFEFVVGSKTMIIGFDKAVIGMKLNEEKTVTIKPAEGFGEIRQNLHKSVPRNIFPLTFTPKPGTRIVLRSPEGKRFPCTIISFNKSSVKVDLNHPLAGKIVIFTIKIVSISKQQ